MLQHFSAAEKAQKRIPIFTARRPKARRGP
jgi:hypothetical protein